jgi:hypothetical protein
MIYTHVARKGVVAVPCPLDLLDHVSDAEVHAAVEAMRVLNGAEVLPPP